MCDSHRDPRFCQGHNSRAGVQFPSAVQSLLSADLLSGLGFLAQRPDLNLYFPGVLSSRLAERKWKC